MSQAQRGDVVRFDYTAKLEDGSVIGSSEGEEPLEVTVGRGSVIPGLDKALEGMQPGEVRTVDIPPEEGYGNHKEELVLEVPRAAVPEHMDPRPGERVPVKFANGRETTVTVTQVSESSVTLDANHPLAGKHLVVDVRLVDIV